MDVVLADFDNANKKTEDVAKNRRITGRGPQTNNEQQNDLGTDGCSDEVAQREEAFVLRYLCENALILYELGAWPALCMILALELENTPNALKITGKLDIFIPGSPG